MGSPPRNVLVWDIFIRGFHWLVVVLVAAAYATWRLNWMAWHGWIGEAVLALVLFRLSWAFLGGETARFSGFLASPRTVSQYLKDWLRREPDHQVGHNPAGGWMVVLLLALLLVETLSGLYVANDIADEGPLTEIVPAWVANAIASSHAIVWGVLLTAIAPEGNVSVETQIPSRCANFVRGSWRTMVITSVGSPSRKRRTSR